MQIENWKEIGKSYIELTEHIRTNLIYPELNNNADRFWTVQLELVLSPDGRIKTLKPHTPDINLRIKVHPTTRKDFINNAKKVIHSFEGWVPDLINHEYQLTKRIETVTFNYHKLTLIDQSIILNPEVRAKQPENWVNGIQLFI